METIARSCHSTNITSYDNCINQYAEQFGEKLCKNVDQGLRNSCYLHAAIGSDDESLCRKITSSQMVFTCYGSVAMYNGRLELIHKITDAERRYEWYTTIALRINDSSICRKITEDPAAHGYCMYQLVKRSNDPDLCFFIDTNTLYKDACYYHIAKTYKNESVCQAIGGDILKKSCLFGDDYKGSPFMEKGFPEIKEPGK